MLNAGASPATPARFVTRQAPCPILKLLVLQPITHTGFVPASTLRSIHRRPGRVLPALGYGRGVLTADAMRAQLSLTPGKGHREDNYLPYIRSNFGLSPIFSSAWYLVPGYL